MLTVEVAASWFLSSQGSMLRFALLAALVLDRFADMARVQTSCCSTDVV